MTSFAKKYSTQSNVQGFFFNSIKKQPVHSSGAKLIRHQFGMVILLLLVSMGTSFSTIIFSPQYAIAEPSLCGNRIDYETNVSSINDLLPYENDDLAGEGRLEIQHPANWTIDELHDSRPSPYYREIVQFFAPPEKQDRTDESEDDGYDASLTIIENPYLNNVTSLHSYLNGTVSGTHERVRNAADMQILAESLNGTFLGYPAYRVEGEITLIPSNKDDQETIKFLQVGMIRENKTGYYVKYVAKSSEYEKNLGVVEKMISSIEIDEDKDNNTDAVINSAYCNDDLGIAIRYPSNWLQAEIRSNANPVAFFSPREDGEFDGFWEYLTLLIGSPAEGMPIHEFVRQRINEYRAFDNFNVMTVEEITLRDSIPAFNLTMQYDIQGVKLMTQEIIRIKDGIAYLLQYNADYRVYAKYSSIIKEMIDSFEIYDTAVAKDKVAQQNLLQGININGVPTYLSVNPETNRVYVANQISNFVSVIDGSSSRILDTIPVGIGPLEIDTSSDRYINMVFVVNQRSNDISKIDGANNRVIETLPTLENPIAIKVDPNDLTVYTANASHLTVVNGLLNNIKKNITLSYDNGSDVARYIALDTYNDMVYISFSCSACLNSTISVINASSTSNYAKEEGEIIVPGVAINALSINPLKGLLYAGVVSRFGINGGIAEIDLSTIDTSTRNETINYENFVKLYDEHAAIGNIDVPISLDVSLKNNTIYVATINNENPQRRGIHVINGANNIREDFLQLNGSNIKAIKVDSYRNIIYAADAEKKLIYKINGNTNNQLKLIYEVNFDISPPNSGTMNCDIVEGISNGDQSSKFEVSDATRLEFDHGTTLSCDAKPKTDYLLGKSQIEELIGVRDVSDDYRFEGFSLVGKEDLDKNTKVAIKEQELIPINGHLNLTANFKQIDPSFSPSQVQTIHGVILSAVLTTVVGGGIGLYKKRKRSTLVKYGRAIDTIYRVFQERNSDECIQNLNQIRTKLLDLLNESKISEEDYAELNARISQYEDGIRQKKEKS
jgi:YVTN family beta-propeller protein